jgi:hypothetical protein
VSVSSVRQETGNGNGLEATAPAVARAEVAVLFADPKGVYAGIEGVDLWDEARDARLSPSSRIPLVTAG